MPHVTFIHGIANKPSKEKLLDDWRWYLKEGGLNLAAEGVTTSMVYWAHVMYPKPEESGNGYESVDGGLGTNKKDEDLEWVDALSEQEKAFVSSFREKLGFDKVSPEDDNYRPIPATEDPSFEAIPLPWFIKRRLMKILLKDVHHYLFNTRFSPRPQEEFHVQDYIRKLFLNQLKEDTRNRTGPHIVVSHSMGTVISYDCLKHMPDCPQIDAYMTVGSPLGLTEVQDNFQSQHKYQNAFPRDKVKGEWVNIYDRFDPVALDAHLSNDYRENNKQVVHDQAVSNTGLWRHSADKYYEQKVLCNHLRRLLEI